VESLIHIRTGGEADIDRVSAFYAALGNSTQVSTGEQFVLAEDGGQLIGAVRLCTENGHAILRTMRVSESYRRQGIGKHNCVCSPETWSRLVPHWLKL
jgi:N-acetylglutamate synthase-like GNAT family acetyltransferase